MRKKSEETGRFADVTLDCAGPLGGWESLGDLEYTRVDLVTGNFQGVNGCDNGRHEMTSAAPFAVTVWSWGNTIAVSYAYTAGGGLQPLNDVEVPPTPQ